jgi:hypothetical protein
MSWNVVLARKAAREIEEQYDWLAEPCSDVKPAIPNGCVVLPEGLSSILIKRPGIHGLS